MGNRPSGSVMVVPSSRIPCCYQSRASVAPARSQEATSQRAKEAPHRPFASFACFCYFFTSCPYGLIGLDFEPPAMVVFMPAYRATLVGQLRLYRGECVSGDKNFVMTIDARYRHLKGQFDAKLLVDV